MRNTHLLAVAPTVSNSVITGGISAGIEPMPANIYTLMVLKVLLLEKIKYYKHYYKKKEKIKINGGIKC